MGKYHNVIGNIIEEITIVKNTTNNSQRKHAQNLDRSLVKVYNGFNK